MTKSKTAVVLAIAALSGIVMAFGAFHLDSVSAQTPTEMPEPEETENAAPLRRTARFLRGGEVAQEALAEALGIDLETLNAAHETAVQKALDQAVSAGLITQAQADRFDERGFGWGLRFGKGLLDESEINFDALLAEALNISVDELNAAREAVAIAAIDNAVAQGAITEEQGELMKGRRALFANEGFQSSMQSAFEVAVHQAVNDGVITQAQADLILQAQQERGRPFGRGGWLDGDRPRGGGCMHLFPDDERPFFPGFGPDF